MTCWLRLWMWTALTYIPFLFLKEDSVSFPPPLFGNNYIRDYSFDGGKLPFQCRSRNIQFSPSSSSILFEAEGNIRIDRKSRSKFREKVWLVRIELPWFSHFDNLEQIAIDCHSDFSGKRCEVSWITSVSSTSHAMYWSKRWKIGGKELFQDDPHLCRCTLCNWCPTT